MNGSDTEGSEETEVDDRLNELTGKIIGAAITVHRVLGPGLLERTYSLCLAAELEHLGVSVEREVPVRVVYRGVDLECGYRLDMLVEGCVVVEVKVVAQLHPVFTSQLLTYLRLKGLRVGLLINFNVDVMTAGIRRVVWGHRVKRPSAHEQDRLSGQAIDAFRKKGP